MRQTDVAAHASNRGEKVGANSESLPQPPRAGRMGTIGIAFYPSVNALPTR
ncbi:hypothetical protein THI4931_18390 [Pandoraea sputorum]|nr:hypothetical protein THI4931_18390 [Pandoraea sputorum]